MIEDKNTNIVYLSECLRDKHKVFYNRLTSLFDSLEIKYDILKDTKDYWCRDYMPIQLDTNEFLMYQYNPDYLQEDEYNKLITDSRPNCKELGINYRETSVKLDGGNVVLCGDVVVMTDKVFAENQDMERSKVVEELENIFDCPVIFIPWKKYDDDEYGHADGFIKYAGGKNILLADKSATQTADYDEIQRILTEKGFNVTTLDFKNYNKYNWAYINFLQVGDKIIMPTFGVDNDEVAKKQIELAFPYCSVHMIDKMKNIVKKGGALHCITWNIKRTQ